MRLDKYLVWANIGSRKDVHALIKAKQVIVNAQVITKTDYPINEKQDKVYVKEVLVKHQENYYYVLNKPSSYVCALNDNYQETIIDYIKKTNDKINTKNLLIVGRLDKDTEGLILLTTDGDFVHQVTSPLYHLEKEYFVLFSGTFTTDIKHQLEQGVIIDNDYKTSPSVLKELNDGVTITICEGKFHQVKKMFLAMGLKVTYLKRIRIGSLILDDTFPLGSIKELLEDDLKKYFNYIK